ncbi:hypothetical protein FB45DRAFT_750122, partial [Roridomyces roridus]
MKTALKAADKYGIIFDTLDPPPEIQRALPMFHHFGQDSSKRKQNNGRVFECLRESHAVQTIGDGMDAAMRLNDPGHVNYAGCPCDACEHDRDDEYCSNPDACARAARETLHRLQPKWNP